MALTQYDPKLIVLNVKGRNISGYADGTFVEVEREADAFSKTTGADGEVTRVKSQNLTGSIKVTLQQGSPSNDFISSLATQDEQTSDAVFPVLLKDANGTTIAQGSKCWVKKKANTTYGKDAENREWTFDVAQLSYDVGGNTAL